MSERADSKNEIQVAAERFRDTAAQVQAEQRSAIGMLPQSTIPDLFTIMSGTKEERYRAAITIFGKEEADRAFKKHE